MQPSQDKEKTTNQASQDYSTRVFLFALELIPSFGIPAIIGFYINKLVLGSFPNAGTAATATIFFIMYVFSWVYVVMRYRSIKQKQQK